MIYLDTETCGLHGMPVLIQYAINDGPIILFEPWTSPIYETLELIEMFMENEVCGFNLSFDIFHLYKIYTTFRLWIMQGGSSDIIPEDHIDELAILEEKARFLDICIKPKAALDLMLYARRGPYQSLMERDDIRIKRIPTALSQRLADFLSKNIQFDDIYFVKQKDNTVRWKIMDIKDKETGRIIPDFKDIRLKFRASGALKALAIHVLKIPKEDVLTFGQIEVSRNYWPEEIGYAPFALAVVPDYHETKVWRGEKRGAWPAYIHEHILHWSYHEQGRKYASDDVKYTRLLHYHFSKLANNDQETNYTTNKDKLIPAGDDDSELACMVACVRWHGYALDPPKLTQLRDEAREKIKKTPKAPKQVRAYLSEVMNDIEKIAIQESTKKVVLEDIAKWESDDPITEEELANGMVIKLHPAAIRARQVLDARKAEKEINLYEKLLLARRFHADFDVIGTLSSRMGGGGSSKVERSFGKSSGINSQGINHQHRTREAFPLADSSIEILATSIGLSLEQTQQWINKKLVSLTNLCGGDFKSFEVSLAEVVFADEGITEILLTGKKIHAELGQLFFPGKTAAEILATEGQDPDLYDLSKKGVFAIFYGGEGYTLHTRLGIPREIGDKAYSELSIRFKGIGRTAQEVTRKFASLQQPSGIGTKIYYSQPADYEESFLGFRRYFTLENKIIKALFELAQNLPESWKQLRIKVQRRDRQQTVSGAVQSALFGCAFAMQQAIIRAAKNHRIQSPGAIITKAVQRAIWEAQPSGISVWIVQPMNIHDEIMAPTRPGYEQIVADKAQAKVAEYKQKIRFLAIDWFNKIPNWASKKAA